jgi:flagellar assembly protein FliH
MPMAKTVLSKEEAEKVAMAYSLRKFPTTISKTASDFVAFKAGSSSSFQIDNLVAEQSGIAHLERVSIEEKVEQMALARLKDIQEQAYQHAYQLGLDEGREKAFLERKGEFEEKVQHLEDLVGSIARLKEDLVAANENQIVSLVFYLAKRLMMKEIQEKPEFVLEVIRTAVESAQSDENVTVRLSPSDYEFVEGIKEKLGKEFESVKSARLESSPEVSNGGCVVETNYGDVNATLEQRMDKLWSSLSEKFHKVKNVIGS